MRSSFDVREHYIGLGNLSAYTFDFKIESLEQLQVAVYDVEGFEIHRVRGTDTTYLSSVVFDPNEGGGTVNLQANLPSGQLLVLLLADDAPVQTFRFKNKFDFTLERIEKALDFLSGQIQRTSYLSQRAVRVSDYVDEVALALFNAALPSDLADNPGATIAINMDGTGFMIGPTTQQILDAAAQAELAQAAAEAAQASAEASAASAAESAANAGLPPGGDTGWFITKDSNVDGDATWKSGAFDGYSARFGALFTSTDVIDTLAKIINLQYTGPAVSLAASGNGTIREKGTPVTSVNLSATVTKRSNPIGAVRFLKDGVLIHTVPTPNPNGGVEAYAWTGSFSDNSTFTVQVDDTNVGGNQTLNVTSNAAFTFVYPYFNGAAAPGANVAAIQALTKSVITSNANLARTMVATNGQVFYFAYPSSYGALTSILDVNNFETLPDWTRTTRSFVGLDTTSQSYYVYEFNNPVVAGSYTYTFKR